MIVSMADEAFFNAHKNEYNCYAYAVGDKSSPNEFINSIPGAAAGSAMKIMTPFALKEGLIKDGAIPAENPDNSMLPPPSNLENISLPLLYQR